MTKYNHTTIISGEPCPLCGEPFLMYWKDKEERYGHSDTTTVKEGKEVHYRCTGGKSLQQLNEERKKIKLNKYQL